MLDSRTTAFIFPGQGSQVVGMGAALITRYPVARQTFEEADDLLGFALSKLCADGPEETLTDTINAQPALFVSGIAALRTLYEQWQDESYRPALVAGHSLGEITALAASGALSFADGLKLVRRRGELMKEAGENSPGGMAALLGLDLDAAQMLCADTARTTGGVIVVANDNCPGQLVIAGDNAALDYALEQALAAGAKRAIKLPVSIAAHSPLMAHVASEFANALENTLFQNPIVPIVGNTQAQILETVGDIRAELNAQLTSSVKWTDSVKVMQSRGITTYVEFGSKNVLIGLLKRIDREASGFVVDAPEGVEALVGAA